MLIKPIITGILETGLNQYLAMDDDKNYFLAPLKGKIIAITISPFDETIYLCPSSENIQIVDYVDKQPDTIISGTLSALGLMGFSKTPMHALFSGEVNIEGDAHIAHQFQRLFEQLDIDLEQQLAKVTGDVIAHQIGNVFRNGQSWRQESIETFRLNVKEFLQHETKDLPSSPEADIFHQQVDKVRNDYDRLIARLTEIGTSHNLSHQREKS